MPPLSCSSSSGETHGTQGGGDHACMHGGM
jgi:hypothetical protein